MLLQQSVILFMLWRLDWVHISTLATAAPSVALVGPDRWPADPDRRTWWVVIETVGAGYRMRCGRSLPGVVLDNLSLTTCSGFDGERLEIPLRWSFARVRPDHRQADGR